MFSSLASFIFGTSTSANTDNTPENPKNEQQPQSPDKSEHHHHPKDEKALLQRIDEDQTFSVTQLTPSVTGGEQATNARLGKRGKSKKARRTKPDQAEGGPQQLLLTPGESATVDADDFDEEDWFIVEGNDALGPLISDSEGERDFDSPAPSPIAPVKSKRRPQLYSPQDRHPELSNPNSKAPRHLLLQLSPEPQRLNVSRRFVASHGAGRTAADVSAMVRSLYVASASADAPHNVSGGSCNSDGSALSSNGYMEESWFVTPPPCFTSIGPVIMETSPFENLLIEHPSMSVYHSIRSAQASESFVDLTPGTSDTQAEALGASTQAPVLRMAPTPAPQSLAQRNNERNSVGDDGSRTNRFAANQKQELLLFGGQSIQVKNERQLLCRGALKRANKVREYQSKGNRQRRSDMQHCRFNSGANNNRKCCSVKC